MNNINLIILTISIEANLTASIRTSISIQLLYTTLSWSLCCRSRSWLNKHFFVQWRAALYFHANCQSAVCLGHSPMKLNLWIEFFKSKNSGREGMILMDDCQWSSLSSWPWAASAPKLLPKPLQTRRWPEQNQCQLFFVCFVSCLYLPPDSIVWNLGVKLGCPRINKITCRSSLMTNRKSDPFDENHASGSCKLVWPSISRI